MTTFAVFFVAALISTAGVGLFRIIGRRYGLVDHPNERSSHSIPVPRGAGIVIVLICVIAYIVISVLWEARLSWGYLAGAFLIAGISWLDDVYSIPTFPRLLVHSLGAVIVIFDLGYLDELYLPVLGFNVDLGAFGAPLTFLWIVWVVNAYNFMDGIDGIAGLQGIITAIGWCLIGSYLSVHGLFLYAGVVAATCFGFLIHNWQPAKVFLGDVGSSFLGFTFAIMPLFFRNEKPELGPIFPVLGICLLWLFLLDTVLTFVGRLIRKQRVWSAHREHIYQRLVIGGASHWSVALMYGLLSLTIATVAAIWVLKGAVAESVGAVLVIAVTFIPIIFHVLQKKIDLNT